MLARLLPAIGVTLLVGLTTVHAEMLQIGDEFPDWSLVDHTGADVSSVAYTGRSYVIWFYPAAMAPACTAEGRGFHDNFQQFRDAGIAVLGVSFDPPEINGVFAAAEGFPYPLLSDTERELATRVGAAESAGASRPQRISYLVGADGRVLKAYGVVHPARHPQEVLLDVVGRTP